MAHCRLLVTVEPFAYVVRNHVRHDSNYKGYKSIHSSHPLSFSSPGITGKYIIPQISLFVNYFMKLSYVLDKARIKMSAPSKFAVYLGHFYCLTLPVNITMTMTVSVVPGLGYFGYC